MPAGTPRSIPTTKPSPGAFAFLERARDVRADLPDNIPLVRHVLWLGDAMAIVQDWADGLPLSINNRDGIWENGAKTIH